MPYFLGMAAGSTERQANGTVSFAPIKDCGSMLTENRKLQKGNSISSETKI